MDANQFKNILSTFADSKSEIVFDKDEIVVNVRDEIIELSLIRKGGELQVNENGNIFSVDNWIINRLAKLPQLADRILDYVSEEKNFICPQGFYLSDINTNPEEKVIDVEDVMQTIVSAINENSALSSNVIYITSDAGEGKTTVINELARQQAKEFKNKKVNWLLVPIMLGGRPFLRFDDIIIASLVNRFRFPIYYYDSFLELVKLGLIVPAFDGFEEMFMESASGEALSALGQLMNKLDSQGSVIIAARKAYFDYKSFTLQAKLFDTIGKNFVSFSRLSLQRWNNKQFKEYAFKRNIKDPEKLYGKLSEILSPDHSILTRAVLVKQLIDIVAFEDNYEDLARKIKFGDSKNYFENFVKAIVEREANLKWIDKSGETAQPLISFDDHFSILSLLAQEMWINNTDALSAEIFDVVSDIFADQKKLNPSLHRQVKERIKQHALIVSSTSSRNSFSFDHDEFKQFFLGVAIIQRMNEKDKLTLLQILKKSLLPSQTLETIIQNLKIIHSDVKETEKFLYELCDNEGPSSYVRENLGSIIIALVSGHNESLININNLILPQNSLSSIKLSNIIFTKCYFQNTSLENASITNCKFLKCTFDRIEFYYSTVIKNCELHECSVNSVYEEKSDHSYYDPIQINNLILKYSFVIKENDKQIKIDFEKEKSIDEKLALTEKIIRRFIKSTQINENIIKVKLGKLYNTFENEVLPDLIKTGILMQIEYYGSGSQRRFKLGKNMEEIERALVKSNGNFNNFLMNF